MSTSSDRRVTFERQQQIMKMFSDNTKTYIQLGGAALGLTLTFAHEILHVPQGVSIADEWMVARWVCFLVAIVAGAFYQVGRELPGHEHRLGPGDPLGMVATRLRLWRNAGGALRRRHHFHGLCGLPAPAPLDVAKEFRR